MSIDERLRAMQVPVDEPASPDLVLLDQISQRAHVRQRRDRTVAVVAAAATLAVVVAAPIWWSRTEGDSGPVYPPTPSPGPTASSTPPPTRTSPGPQAAAPRPVEAPGWTSAAATEQVWLRAFVGTEDEAQARQVYRAARFEGLPLTLELQHGMVTVRIGHNGNVEAAPVLTLFGSYRVDGHVLALRLEDVGNSRYRWAVDTSGPGDSNRRLTLTYLDGAGPTQFGAPADVLLRLLLTSAPFTYHQGP